jgi:hypothetical protein
MDEKKLDEKDAKNLYRNYKSETDEEIERVRSWVRSLIDAGIELSYNNAVMNVLSRIVYERQKTKIRREFLAELTVWGKLLATLLATFSGGVVVGLGAALPLWKSVVRWLGW